MKRLLKKQIVKEPRSKGRKERTPLQEVCFDAVRLKQATSTIQNLLIKYHQRVDNYYSYSAGLFMIESYLLRKVGNRRDDIQKAIRAPGGLLTKAVASGQIAKVNRAHEQLVEQIVTERKEQENKNG